MGTLGSLSSPFLPQYGLAGSRGAFWRGRGDCTPGLQLSGLSMQSTFLPASAGFSPGSHLLNRICQGSFLIPTTAQDCILGCCPYFLKANIPGGARLVLGNPKSGGSAFDPPCLATYGWKGWAWKALGPVGACTPPLLSSSPVATMSLGSPSFLSFG